MADTFGTFAVKLDQMRNGLTDDAVSHAMGKAAKKIAEREASADLGGDPKFSGWSARLDTRYDIVGPGKVLFKPTPRSAGPWTVATVGRNQGNAPGFAGPGVNRSTGLTARTKSGGVRKVRARRAKRWNGVTAGKGTADRAVARIESEVPKIVERHVRSVIRRTL